MDVQNVRNAGGRESEPAAVAVDVHAGGERVVVPALVPLGPRRPEINARVGASSAAESRGPVAVLPLGRGRLARGHHLPEAVRAVRHPHPD